MSTVSQYAQTRNARKAERKAKAAALDAALRAYTAARAAARANGSKPPHINDYVPAKGL